VWRVPVQPWDIASLDKKCCQLLGLASPSLVTFADEAGTSLQVLATESLFEERPLPLPGKGIAQYLDLARRARWVEQRRVPFGAVPSLCRAVLDQGALALVGLARAAEQVEVVPTGTATSSHARILHDRYAFRSTRFAKWRGAPERQTCPLLGKLVRYVAVWRGNGLRLLGWAGGRVAVAESGVRRELRAARGCRPEPPRALRWKALD